MSSHKQCKFCNLYHLHSDVMMYVMSFTSYYLLPSQANMDSKELAVCSSLHLVSAFNDWHTDSLMFSSSIFFLLEESNTSFFSFPAIRTKTIEVLLFVCERACNFLSNVSFNHKLSLHIFQMSLVLITFICFARQLMNWKIPVRVLSFFFQNKKKNKQTVSKHYLGMCHFSTELMQCQLIQSNTGLLCQIISYSSY